MKKSLYICNRKTATRILEMHSRTMKRNPPIYIIKVIPLPKHLADDGRTTNKIN